jgi:hypothetical protein
MNAVFDIFSGFSLFDCIAFQHDPEEEAPSVLSPIAQGEGKDDIGGSPRDSCTIFTGHEVKEIEDQLTEESAGESAANFKVLGFVALKSKTSYVFLSYSYCLCCLLSL